MGSGFIFRKRGEELYAQKQVLLDGQVETLPHHHKKKVATNNINENNHNSAHTVAAYYFERNSKANDIIVERIFTHEKKTNNFLHRFIYFSTNK